MAPNRNTRLLRFREKNSKCYQVLGFAHHKNGSPFTNEPHNLDCQQSIKGSPVQVAPACAGSGEGSDPDRKSTRLNSSH